MYDETRYGVITEQGDLGLGFNPISAKEQRIVQENERNKNSPKDSTKDKE